MANPNELNLNNEQVEGDFDNMPTGMSGMPTPPQPGIILFQLPSSEIIYQSFSTIAHEQQGQRLQVSFKEDSALIMLPNNQPYHSNLSNVTRVLNFKSGPVVVSDMAMLLKALGIKPEHMTNAGYAQAMVNAGGMQFKGEHTLSTNCNPKRDIYLAEGGEQKGKKGCGQKYAVESYTPKNPPGARVVLAIPKDDDGLVMTRFDCVCGASLRSWGRLRGFKAAS